jgi:hypothetical protein
VFSYGKFISGGSGFKVSEATFLTTPHPDFTKHPVVKKVTVLVLPSNPAIKKLYSKLPHVKVIPMKLKARLLNIDTMLTLMAIDESANLPLYLASVIRILRQMATENIKGFDYLKFKSKLKSCQFSPA